MKRTATAQDIRESGLVNSSQSGVHPRLDAIVRKHLESPWSQPLHRASADAFQALEDGKIFRTGRPLILDSGCGTGESTRRLARMFPGHLVIGVDRSQKRLGKGGVETGVPERENHVLVRAELATFWRLLHESGRSPERHFLFYPNPWPKPGHLMRRWHAHPVFPVLLALGGDIELRCNWEIYAREFARAAGLATGFDIAARQIFPEPALSPFEHKYLERGQALYSVVVPARFTREFRLSRQGWPG